MQRRLSNQGTNEMQVAKGNEGGFIWSTWKHYGLLWRREAEQIRSLGM